MRGNAPQAVLTVSSCAKFQVLRNDEIPTGAPDGDAIRKSLATTGTGFDTGPVGPAGALQLPSHVSLAMFAPDRRLSAPCSERSGALADPQLAYGGALAEVEDDAGILQGNEPAVPDVGAEVSAGARAASLGEHTAVYLADPSETQTSAATQRRSQSDVMPSVQI